MMVDQFQVIGVAVGDDQPRRVIQVFADQSEAQEFQQFLEKGRAFSRVWIETATVRNAEEPLLVDHPSAAAKVIYVAAVGGALLAGGILLILFATPVLMLVAVIMASFVWPLKRHYDRIFHPD